MLAIAAWPWGAYIKLVYLLFLPDRLLSSVAIDDAQRQQDAIGNP